MGIRIQVVRLGNWILVGAVVASVCGGNHLAAQDVRHQPFSVDARVGAAFPVGDLAQGQRGIATGVGSTRGVAALLRLHPTLSVFGGWTRHGFTCDTSSDCAADAEVASSGYDVGVQWVLPHRTTTTPWVRAGLLLHRFSYDLDGVVAESERTPGVELGVGADVELHRFFALTPALRFGYYQTQLNLETFNTGAEDFIVSLVALDIGGRLRF